MKFKINANIDGLKTQRRKDIATVTHARAEFVINSNEFKRQILELMVEPLTHEKSDWKDARPMEIYEHFISGSEVLSPTKDNEMDIDLAAWSRMFSRVVGWTKPDIKTIYVNTKFYDNGSHKSRGSNLVHEYGHKLGFKHPFKRPFHKCICYRLNTAFENAYDSIFPDEKPEVKTLRRSWWRRLIGM
jgi:hypothetical protein